MATIQRPTARLSPRPAVSMTLDDEMNPGGRPTLAPDSKPTAPDLTTGQQPPTLAPRQSVPVGQVPPVPPVPQPVEQTATVTPPTLQPMPVPQPEPQPTGGFPQTDPDNPLTERTIQRDPLVDRFNLARQQFDTFVQGTDPQYQAALRQANRYGAATGRLGSGDLRTDFGNLAQQRDLQLRTAQNEFLQGALGGSIEDQFRDIGIAQQQQGFQNQQQQQAFENELRRLGFSEEMLNSAFGRALQTYMAGQAGGTGSATGVTVGQNQMAQGQSALDALNAMIRNQPAVGAPTMGTGLPTRWPWQTPPIVPEGAG